MIKPVSPRLNITVMEEAMLRFWKTHDIFRQSLESRQGGEEYVVYEGPPTANGKPGVHHVLARAFKDLFPRYKTMRGFHVARRGGWDTHGLPVEIEMENQLGIKNKHEIESYGIERFNDLCRRSALAYIQDWEKLTERIAYWVDLQDAYITFENPYIESVWWILKNLWEKSLLYQAFKVVPYCPRCGTALADHEVALGYDEAVDPSIYVRMPLVGHPDTSLLVWTTTPWTLPANVAIAVKPDVDYVTVERELAEGGKERLILARALIEKVFRGEAVKIVETFKGKALKGRRYQPLFTFLPPDKPAHFVIMGDFVTTEDGTGLVHIAPAYGAEDMAAALDLDLPILMTVTDSGTFIPEVRPWSGKFVKDADPFIVQDLENRGLLFRSEQLTHTYPFCWRCGTALLYYARPTWYIRTSQYKDQMVALNQEINWYPSHVKDGRFGNWLANNVDWALGRERYWGTPLPVWECDQCHQQECFGSLAELSERAGKDLGGLDLHRPSVDEIPLACTTCQGTMHRIPEVIDVWFDSGSMPVAQWHYPFENAEVFQRQFPADYICEAVDQTRGWFYALHAISTMLFERTAFKNVVCLGLILDSEGQKMSKARGNVIDPWDVISQHGADAIRWYFYTAGAPGQERRFSAELVGEVVRNFVLTLWNTYSFFTTYASIDRWQPGPVPAPAELSPLDRWLLSELNVLVRDVTLAFETYDVPGATRPIEAFVDNLSNWYLRRSRRRFWKSQADADKTAAYMTLYQALTTLARLLAPAMPFLAEELYQNLVREVEEEAPLSVHLTDWPIVEEARIDAALNQEMRLVMRLASLGHAARNQANRKVRQPLAEAAFALGSAEEAAVVERYADLLEDELNVKNVRVLGAAEEAVAYSLNPLPKQLGQKYHARYPAVRQAILDAPMDEAVRSLLAGESLHIQMDGQPVEILPEEVEVRAQPKAGFAVASDGATLAALVTELTPELVREGLAREFVRRVQDLRKQAELDVAGRIKIIYLATPGLEGAIQVFRDYIVRETLAEDLIEGALPHGIPTTVDEFDGEKLTVGIIRGQ